MDDSLLLNLIAILILLILSAFFSGSESAFFSIDYITREKLKQKKIRSLKLIYKLLKIPNRLLITILIGNIFVNIFASSLASEFAINIVKSAGLTDVIGTSIAIGVMSIIIIMFGEITPKIIAVSNPVKFAQKFSYPVQFIIFLLRPISIIFQYITDFITNKIIKYSPEVIKEKDIESIIKIGHKEGIIDEDERIIMENVFESIKKEVSEIMIPRPKLFMVNIENGDRNIIKNIVKNKWTRILVYKENRDNIVGVIRKKDILPIHFNHSKVKSIKELINPVLFVPENKKINDLLREMQKEKKDFAVVVDEYGGTAGGVSIENIIEAIMGEYQTDDDQNNILFRRIGKNKYLITGDMKIEEFNQIFGANLRAESADTISGLIMEYTEKVPSNKEKIIIENYDFTVSKTKGPKILTLFVEVRQ